MPDVVVQGLATLTRVLEIAGAGALVLGFVITTVRWVSRSLQQGVAPALAPYRRALGRVVLIGLIHLSIPGVGEELDASWPIGRMLRAEFRGTRCYVELRCTQDRLCFAYPPEYYASFS